MASPREGVIRIKTDLTSASAGLMSVNNNASASAHDLDRKSLLHLPIPHTTPQPPPPPPLAPHSATGPAKPGSRGHDLMRRLCSINPAFASSVLEDYIRPIVREEDVILEIECGTNAALLYLSRLCQGSKGPCIWFQEAWLTPNEFQYISGRETAKDWKRSIRHCGKSMKLLLTKGILTTHPPICDCDGCRISSPVVSLGSFFFCPLWKWKVVFPD